MTGAASACLLCGSRGTVAHRGVSDVQQHVSGVWDIRFCPDCGLAWLDPRPAADEVPSFYADPGYHTHQKTWMPASRCVALLEGRPPGRVLDVGCGNGADLARLRRLGWEGVGIEPDPRAAELARETSGAQVLEGSIEKAALPAGSFDAVLMSQVVEHLVDPIGTLAACKAILKPGGLLIAATPNWGSRLHELFGPAWFPLETPRHVFLFTAASLRAVFERAGLAVQELRDTPHWTVPFYVNSWLIRTHGRLPADPMQVSRPLPITAASLRGAWIRLGWSLRRRAGKGDGEQLELIARKPQPPGVPGIGSP